MNPVDLRNYVSVKSCCLSTKGLSLLDKMRGGQMDPCCMTKHVTARTVSDLMSNAYVQDTWYKLTLNIEGRTINSTMDWSYWEITNSSGEVTRHGRVPNGQASYTIPAGLAAAGKGFELGQQIVELFNQGTSDPLNVKISAVNTTTPGADTYTATVTLFLNENYVTDVDSIITDLNWNVTATDVIVEIDGAPSDPVYSIEKTTERVYPCLTSANMCELATYLDSYCDSCDEYEPDAVT